MEHHMIGPFTKEMLSELKSGDYVYLSGTIYSARDAAHKRMIEYLNQGKELPFEIENQIIYYLGPSPERPGNVIGSAGPTTSGRMDAYTPQLLELGLLGMIGKGKRNPSVKKEIVNRKAVYFAAVGGAGALLSKAILSSEIIAFEDLGTEAIRKLVVKDLPVIVVNDFYGGDLYIEAVNNFKKTETKV